MIKERIQTIAFWVTTIFGQASFVIGGFLFTTHGEHQLEVLESLGYPAYFATILGTRNR